MTGKQKLGTVVLGQHHAQWCDWTPTAGAVGPRKEAQSKAATQANIIA
jgi:hypothetical protein